MIAGQAGIFYLGVESVSPPSGTSGLASNGLSIDPVSGDVVLGNDVGDPAKPAALTSVREIPITGQGIIFLTQDGLVFTAIQDGLIAITTATGLTVWDESGLGVFRSAPGNAQTVLNDSISQISQGLNGTDDAYIWNSNIVGQFGAFQPSTGNWQVGFNPGGTGIYNGATLEVVGNITYDFFIDITGGAIALDDNNDRGKLYTNEGGVSTFTLPVAENARRGLHYMFMVQQAVNLVIQAPVSDTINIDTVVSAAGGTATSSTVGSAVHLVNIGNNQWMALSSQGAWVVV